MYLRRAKNVFDPLAEKAVEKAKSRPSDGAAPADGAPGGEDR
jgi:hypothetical protein